MILQTDTATDQLRFWMTRYRDMRRLYDSPVLDDNGRLTALHAERRAAVRVLDILAEMPEEDVRRIGGGRW